MLYERYLQCWWNFDGNPFSKIPNELKITCYPLSFQYYDAVPILIAKYFRGKVRREISHQDKLVDIIVNTTRDKFYKNIEDHKENGNEDGKEPDEVAGIRNDASDNSVKKKLTERPKLMRHQTFSFVRFPTGNFNKKKPQQTAQTKSLKNWLKSAEGVGVENKSQQEVQDNLVRKMTREKLVNVYVDLIMRLHAELTDENDKVRLVIKELKLKQLLALKTRGRFLDETKGFEGDFKVLPSHQSQKKMVSYSALTE